MRTKKHLKVFKIMHAWTHQPERTDRLSPALLHRLWFVLLSHFIFSITFSSSFPLCSSLFIKEGTTFAFPGGKRAVTGWGRERFSDGRRRRRTATCLEMHQKCWPCSWRPGTASWSCSIALTKKDAPSENGILMTGDHLIAIPLGKTSLQTFLSSRSCLSHWLCGDSADYSRTTVLFRLTRT